MSEDGYTLTECLVAMAILAFVAGGLAETSRLLTRTQRRADAAHRTAAATHRIDTALSDLVGAAGPFGAGAPAYFAGDRQGLAFDCGRAAYCTARIVQGPAGWTLSTAGGDGAPRTVALGAAAPAFRYVSADGAFDRWPPAAPAAGALRSIALYQDRDGGEVALATARLWPEEPRGCRFDTIAGACREDAR